MADEAFNIGPAASADSYLKADTIIDIAGRVAPAIHPGYGFLSENTALPKPAKPTASCSSARPLRPSRHGLQVRRQGDYEKAGVPRAGYRSKGQSPDLLRAEAEKCGFPLLLKAVAGGGGKGMRVVETMADFDDAGRRPAGSEERSATRTC